MIRSLFTASFVLPLIGAACGQAQSRRAEPLTIAQVWKLDATYTDQQHGVTFRYPSIWKAETQFGYHPPALTMSEEEPITGFGYEEGGFPRQRVVGPYSATNLEGFGIVYSAAVAVNANECEARVAAAAETPKHGTVAFGGRSFSKYETGEAGMSQTVSGSLYATYVRPVCYLFETDIATASPDVLDDIRALTPAQERSINTHLLDIMKSVRIVPREQRNN
jgi:hypothetical protein